MKCFSFVALSAVFFTLAILCSGGSGAPENQLRAHGHGQTQVVVMETNSVEQALVNGQSERACYPCSAPCDIPGYGCCDHTGYPQCCYDPANNKCGCCRNM